MIEILIASGIAAVVFALFILAFLIRKRPPDEPVHVHRCANCDCERDDRDLQRARRFLERRGRNSAAASGKRDVS